MEIADTTRRVLSGAAMLDWVYGGRAVWARGIDRDRLSLTDNTGCVLGQLLGSYDDGVAVLFGGNYGDAVRYGFDMSGSDQPGALVRMARVWRHVLYWAARQCPSQFEIVSTWTADPDRVAGSEGDEFFYVDALRRLADLRVADPDRTHVYSVRRIGPAAPAGLADDTIGG